MNTNVSEIEISKIVYESGLFHTTLGAGLLERAYKECIYYGLNFVVWDCSSDCGLAKCKQL